MSTVVPPRRVAPPKELFHREKITSLDILMSLGISRTKALNALAATGGRSAKEAMSWLVSHFDDRRLNDIQLRDFALVAVPFGVKFNQLHNIFEMSRKYSCWNLANNYLPHIMLEPFFQVRSQCEQELMEGFSKLKQKIVHCENIEFEMIDDCTKRSYIVRSPYLKIIADTFFSGIERTENRNFNSCLRIGRNSEAYVPSSSPKEKDLELLIIAGEIPTEEYTEMLWYANSLNMEGANEWEVRLYSRHPAAKDKQVYRTKQNFDARRSDEMDTEVGDYLIIDRPFSALEPDSDWCKCVNLMTGKSGLVPMNHIERVPESDCWSLHGSIVTHSPEGEKARIERALKPYTLPEHHRWAEPAVRKTIESLKNFTSWNPNLGNRKRDYTNHPEYQSLLIMCHSECVDSVFPNWTVDCFIAKEGTEYCSTEELVYNRCDSNLPGALLERKGDDQIFLWKRDPPITKIGSEQARLTGELFLEQNVNIECVLCSPAYRCLQTARAVLQAMGLEERIKICIEPALFDYFGYYFNIPTFVNTVDLKKGGFNIDIDYCPKMTVFQLVNRHKNGEDPKHFYKRNQLVSEFLDKKRKGTVLIVGHPLNLDTNSQSLLKFKQPETKDEIFELNKQIPNSSVLFLEKRGKWSVRSPPTLPITHNFNFIFDWSMYEKKK